MSRRVCEPGFTEQAIPEQIVTCLGCPVRLECLAWALDVESPEQAVAGVVFGGATGPERARLIALRDRTASRSAS